MPTDNTKDSPWGASDKPTPEEEEILDGFVKRNLNQVPPNMVEGMINLKMCDELEAGKNMRVVLHWILGLVVLVFATFYTLPALYPLVQ